MERPTRHEQARAILSGRGRAMAARILGRRPVGSDDYAAAFNLELIDLISEIPDPSALLALGRNRVGPKDGLYIIDEAPDGYRVYLQERGIEAEALAGLDFDAARVAVIERVIWSQGLPFDPPGPRR